jgi:hypothetical protein
MAALVKDRMTPERELRDIGYPVADNAVIYAGAIVMLSATGYARPAATGTGLTVAGVAQERVDNTNGGDGGKAVIVRQGCFKFENGDAIAQADVGKIAYAVDDQTIAKGASGKSPVGVIVQVEADGVWVNIKARRAASAVNADTASGVVATVETEVNELKAALREQGILHTA